GATLAILVAMPIVPAGQSGAPGPGAHVGRALRGMFAASVAAEAMLFPVGAIVFSRVTFAGLGLNFLAIPLMGLAQVAGMLVVPLAAISPTCAAAPGFIAHLGAAGLVQSARVLPVAPFLSSRVAAPPALVVAMYYVAVAGWWTLWRRRVESVGSAEGRRARALRRGAAAVGAIAALWILVDPRTLVAAAGDGYLHATVIDVGQGDAI